MITGENELNVLIHSRLSGIQINTAPTGDPEVLEDVPLYFTPPQEAVAPNEEDGGGPQYPSITVFPYDDVSIEGSPLRQQGLMVQAVDENDLSQGYNVYDHPNYRRYFYQFDLYTQLYTDLLYLQQELFSRLRREFGYLTDDDGGLIYFRMIDVADLTEQIDAERFFRRAFSYSFDAWTLPNPDPIDTIGPVEKVTTDVIDMDDDELYFTVEVPEP